MKKLKTRESQRSAWQRWAAANPEKAQANRNAWAKSAAGKRWLAKNQKKKNRRRDAWRKKKRLEAKKAKSGNNSDQARLA
jgi:hypothetical protein